VPVVIIDEKCTGCQLCVKACPYAAVEVVDGKARLLENCNHCAVCVSACRSDAMVVEEAAPRRTVDISQYHGVWVVAERGDGAIRGVTYELLGEGRRLADTLGDPLAAVLMGLSTDAEAAELIAHGANRVYVVNDPQLDQYQTATYAQALTDLVREHRPAVVLLGATSIGRDLASRVAARLEAGLTADCTELQIDPETHNLVQIRPAFGGNLMATIVCPDHRPQMATVRPKVMKRLPRDDTRQGEVVPVDLEVCADGLMTRVLETAHEGGDAVNLQEAEIIVAGGRGLGKPEHFAMLHELAEVLGGAVAASRAAVDAGWIPAYHQVGQTGKTVQPKLYIACGISGAVQHLAGMQSSDIIVAINRDPDAPIFKVATYGIVGDVFEIVPALTQRVRAALSR
jgi:electron transfer flavoprotein alpha subunit/NAD-dependent dihydropyrimidine dehydrogenase PreA subunit